AGSGLMTEPAIFVAARRTFFLLGSGALVVAALYWGQRIFVPLALAVLLTFVLAPLAARLERRGLKRIPAVLLVACLSFGLIGLAGGLIASQVSSLIDDLPQLKRDARDKIRQLQGTRTGGPLARIHDFLAEVDRAGQPAEAEPATVVRVQPERPSLLLQ